MADVMTADVFRGVECFHFLRPIAQAWRQIRREYDDLEDRMQPWPEAFLHNGGWFAGALVFNRQPMPLAKHAPITMDLVRQVPGVFIAGFSILRPGAVIEPHVGYTDHVLRSHLGLSTNDKAFIEVGGERRQWRDGELFVFDDTVSHHAANPGATDRVVLILDFDRGDL